MSANIKATNTEAIIGVNGGNQLTISDAGVVTANSFVGNVTGNITGNVTGNVTGGGTFSGNASSATALATGSTTARTLANRFADYYYVADFATGDLAARAAFDARVPLNVLSGESAKITCNPTAGDDFQAMCLWFAQCDKAEDATFYIELADGGHTVLTYVDLSNTKIAVDLRASATPEEIPITGITYAAVFGFTYRATVTVSTALPASVEVNSPIGMQNIQGDNDAITANGGQIVETIAGNRLSFTFIFYSRSGAPISPTSLNSTAINGVVPNIVLCPRAWLRCNSAGWDGSSREGFINLINGARMIITYVGFSYDGPGQGPTTASSVTSLSSGGSTIATGTTSSPHGWTTGQFVTIAGATPIDYNGLKTLLSASGSTFTYSVISGLAPATGTITATATDERDMLFAKYNGSFYHLRDKVVIAGAGDKCIRLDSGAGAYINRSCIGSGGKGDRWIDVAGGVTVRLVRTFLGGAKGNAITIGDGSNMNMSQCAMGGGSSGVLLVGAGANLGADVSQLNNFDTGFDANEGVIAMSGCKIDNCTRGVRAKEIEGQIIGAATFTNNVDDIVKITSTNNTAFYRSGTWTPVLSDVTATFSIQNGNYVIIGNIVHCRVRLFSTSLDNTDTSPVKISGLPFAEDGAVYLSTNISVSPKNSTLLKSATSDVYINGYFSAGSITLSKGASDMLYSDMNTSGYLYMSIIYHSAII